MWREGTRRKEKEENQFWGRREGREEGQEGRKAKSQMNEKIMKRGKDYGGRRER